MSSVIKKTLVNHKEDSIKITILLLLFKLQTRVANNLNSVNDCSQ